MGVVVVHEVPLSLGFVIGLFQVVAMQGTARWLRAMLI